MSVVIVYTGACLLWLHALVMNIQSWWSLLIQVFRFTKIIELKNNFLSPYTVCESWDCATPWTARAIIYYLPCIDRIVLSLSMRRQIPLFYEKFDSPLTRALPALIWELTVNVRIKDNTGRQNKDYKAIFTIFISLCITRVFKNKKHKFVRKSNCHKWNAIFQLIIHTRRNIKF